MPALPRAVPVILQLAVIGLCLSLPVLAQSSEPAPAPTPTGKTLSENITALVQRAGELIPTLQSELESPLLPWFEKISIVLAALVLVFSFARLWRENSGAGADVFWWFGRLAVCFALLGSGPVLIDGLHSIGKQIVQGNEMVGESVLSRFYRSQRDSFNESYRKFTEGLFTVKVNGQDVPVKPGPDGTEVVLGVLYDKEASIKDVERKLDVSSWNMATMFSVLNFARGLIEFGDLFLLILGSALLIAVRLAVPFMIVAAIDRHLANRVSYPFAWGVIVLTLVWPLVSYIIRSLAYLAGNVAMALGDSSPLYTWDSATMQVISNPLAQPIYTIVIAATLMLITGLCVWFSPVVAYKISMGQVYETVSSTVSGWAAALVGTGVAIVSSQAAAALSNQAERTQAEGTYAGEVTRATGALDAGNLGVRARQIAAIAAAQGGQVAALGHIYGARTQAVMSAQAGMLFGVNSAAATTELSKGDIQVRAAQSVGDIEAHRDQQRSAIEANRSADTLQFAGQKLEQTGQFVDKQVGRYGGDEDTGKRSLKSKLAGTAAELGLGVAGGYLEYKSIQDRAAGQRSAIDTSSEALIRNQNRAREGQLGNQDVYLNRMTQAHRDYAQGQIDAANAGASQSAGGVNRGTAITISGINRGASLEQMANRITFDASIKSAGQVRDASFEAARLRALSSVIHSVGWHLSRELEQGLTLRY